MKLQARLIILSLCLMCSFKLADAQYGYGYRYYQPGPDAYTHHGFFLSADVGLGGVNYKDSLGITGGAANFNLKIGGTIAPNFILSGDLITVDCENPDVTQNKGIPGFPAGYDYGNNGDDFSMNLIGIGATYYFMPADIFLTGTIGTGYFKFDDQYSNNGLAFQAEVGKEWWVSPNWGLGVGLVLLDMNAKWNSVETGNGGFLGLMFNSTFN